MRLRGPKPRLRNPSLKSLKSPKNRRQRTDSGQNEKRLWDERNGIDDQGLWVTLLHTLDVAGKDVTRQQHKIEMDQYGTMPRVPDGGVNFRDLGRVPLLP